MPRAVPQRSSGCVWVVIALAAIIRFVAAILVFAQCVVPGVFLHSQHQVKAYLQQKYGMDFVILSEERIQNPKAFLAKVYTAAPVNDREQVFYVHSSLQGGSFGVPDISKRLKDMYTEGRMLQVFSQHAEQLGLAYEIEYYSLLEEGYICEEGERYTGARINLAVTEQNAKAICGDLSAILVAMLADPFVENGKYYSLDIVFCGRHSSTPDAYSKNKRFSLFIADGWDTQMDISPDGLFAHIEAMVDGLQPEP